MIISFFRYNYQVEIITIIVAGVALWLWGFSMDFPPIPRLEAATLSSPLFSLQHNWITSASALLILLIESFLLSTITGRFKILRLTNLLPSLVYILLMSFQQNLLTLTPSLLSNFFILILLYYLFDLYATKNHLLLTFNASFILGLAILIIPENALLLPLIWISFIIYRSYGLREWIISLLGIIIVLLFTVSFHYLNNSLESLVQSYSQYFKTLQPGYPDLSAEYIPFTILIGLFTLVTVPRMIFKLDENIIRTRKRLNIVIFLIIIALGTLFINPANWHYNIYMLFVPLSIAISRLIISMKKERNKDWAVLLIVISIILERIL